MLESKDNWSLEMFSESSSAFDIYISLDPSTLGPNNHLWTTSSINGFANLRVSSADENFHISTYYYVYILSNSGLDTIVSMTLRQQKKVRYITNFQSEEDF